MTQLNQRQLIARVRALYDDVDVFAPGVFCPWPLARVFNELLAESKRHLEDDPVVAGIAAVRKQTEDDGTSATHAGTVHGLLGQLLAALEPSG